MILSRRDFFRFSSAAAAMGLLFRSSPGDAQTMFRGNAQHTFYGTGPVSANLKIKWKFRTGAYKSRISDIVWSGTGWTGSPVVDENFVYIGSQDSYFYCLHRDSGKLKWKYKAGAMFKSSPALFAGRIFAGNVDNHLYCLNAETGRVLWKYNTGNDLDSSAAIHNNRIYIGSESGYVFCFDPVDGHIVWRTFLDGLEGEPGSCGVESTPACWNGRIYATNYTGEIFCLRESDGAILWKNITGDDTDASCVISDGIVYTASEDKNPYVHAFDALSGKKIWQFGGKKTGGFWATPAVSDGKIFAGDNRGVMWCLDSKTGKEIWSHKVKASIWSSPSVVDEKVIFGSYDANLYVVNSKTGNREQKIKLHGRVLSTPCIINGDIYVGTSTGMFYCLG